MKMQYLLLLVLMKERICNVLIKFVITARCYIDDDIEILRENIKSIITEISLYETYTSYENRDLKICYEAYVKEEDLSENDIFDFYWRPQDENLIILNKYANFTKLLSLFWLLFNTLISVTKTLFFSVIVIFRYLVVLFPSLSSA